MAFTLQLQESAPKFNLKSTNGQWYGVDDFKNSDILVVFFTCNHCPYVINSDEDTRRIADKFSDKGVQFIAVNSNSVHTKPLDSYEHMVARMKENNFPWIYVHDSTQEVAKLYGALRTPHFFVFDKDRKLVYTGRSVDSPRDMSKTTVHNLEDALSDLVSGVPPRVATTNPIGCNVKWEGQEEHWMPADACDLV